MKRSSLVTIYGLHPAYAARCSTGKNLNFVIIRRGQIFDFDISFRQDLQDYQDFFGLVWLYPVHPVYPVRKWKIHAVKFFIRSNWLVSSQQLV